MCGCAFAPAQESAKGRLRLTAKEHQHFPSTKGRQDDKGYLPTRL
jgi:hypothetical protein